MSSIGPSQKKLIGVWRSDRRRTLQTCHRYHILNRRKKRRFAELFGHLELRYTQRFVYHKLRGFQYRGVYDVIAEDAESIVIRVYSEELKRHIEEAVGTGFEELFRPRLHQITFRELRGRQYYWIGLGQFCEWFQKVSIQPAAAPNGVPAAPLAIRGPRAGCHW